MANCAKCGATVNEGVAFCGSCGTPAGAAAGTPPAAGAPASGGLAPNVAGALAYFTIIPAIIFLVVEPYNKDRFIKFHAFQMLFFAAGLFVCWIPVVIVGWIPFIGWAILVLGFLVLGLGGFACWVFMVYKAYNNEKFMMPVIGKLAEQQASR